MNGSDFTHVMEHVGAYSSTQPKGNRAVDSTAWGACCHENTEKSVGAGGCPPSLDEIAKGLCMDIAKINWIPVIY